MFIYYFFKKKIGERGKESRIACTSLSFRVSVFALSLFHSLLLFDTGEKRKKAKRKEDKVKEILPSSTRRMLIYFFNYILCLGFALGRIWSPISISCLALIYWEGEERENDGSKQFRSVAKRCLLFGSWRGSGICWCVCFISSSIHMFVFFSFSFLLV